MTYVEAKRIAAKLFGPGLKLHRGKNKCFLLDAQGNPLADGRSWLECLRSKGEIEMLKNSLREKEKEAIEEFVKLTGFNPEAMNPDQLEFFDRWMKCKMRGEQVPVYVKPAAAPEPSRIIMP